MAKHTPKGSSKRMSKEEFEKGYIYGKWPGQVGYAYRADMIDTSSGKQIMETLLHHVKWIEDTPRRPLPPHGRWELAQRCRFDPVS